MYTWRSGSLILRNPRKNLPRLTVLLSEDLPMRPLSARSISLDRTFEHLTDLMHTRPSILQHVSTRTWSFVSAIVWLKFSFLNNSLYNWNVSTYYLLLFNGTYVLSLLIFFDLFPLKCLLHVRKLNKLFNAVCFTICIH